jgi:predicted sugar kinase
MIEIHSFPRVHITLLSMHDGGYRVNGGLGFAIDKPTFYVSASKASRWNVWKGLAQTDTMNLVFLQKHGDRNVKRPETSIHA